ncbi:MAG: hypothetical protein KGK10_02170 [Rhodospirillales bacterium]|nr:hypothetical protein [Rhodospirillales bacterium]
MILRAAVLGFGVLLLGGGILAAAAGGGTGAIAPAILGLVIVLGTAFEGRYRAGRTSARGDTPGPGWERTAERFREPDGTPVEVWFNPASGERRYVKK